MRLGSFFEAGGEINDNGSDVITGEAYFLPDLCAHFDQPFSCSFDISTMGVRNDESHYFLVLKILPNTIRCDNDESVLSGDVSFGYFRN